MSLTKETLPAIFDSIDPYLKTVSVLIRTVYKDNGVIVSSNDMRRAFVPGEIEGVKEWIGLQESPEISYLESVWTPEVIQAYEQAKAEALGQSQE